MRILLICQVQKEKKNDDKQAGCNFGSFFFQTANSRGGDK